jgi:hypothetical protein
MEDFQIVARRNVLSGWFTSRSCRRRPRGADERRDAVASDVPGAVDQLAVLGP